MEKKDDKKKKIITIVISILIIIILIMAVSYAFFSTQLSGTDQVVKVGTLDLVLDETSEGISLDNAIGISDSKGMSTAPSTFKLINNGNKAVDYTIYLDDNTIGDTDTRIDDKYLKYNLNKNGTDSGATLLTSIGSNPNRILDSGTIEGKGTNEYSLNLWITDEVDGNYSGQVFSGKLRVEVSQAKPTAVETLLAKVNPEDLDYNSATDAQKKEMWTFSHPETEQTTALTDYRYIGADPNNYVTFNNETWRIIGVFTVDDGTGKKEERLKIIRNESIGNMAWDSNNDWSNATLNANLNSGDYWTNILSDNAKSMIGDTLWYLGGTSNFTSSTNGLTSHFYSYERGTTVYSGRDTSWVGKVGLMYPSDYGYATSGGSTTDRNACLNKELYNWVSSSYSDCKNNDWIFNSSSQWTITPRASRSDFVFSVSGTGDLYNSSARLTFGVRPVVFLKSSIKIVDGDGSSSNPYVLSF